MADIPISSLPAAAGLGGGELVPMVQGGVTVRGTTQLIAELAVGPSGVTPGTYGDAANVPQITVDAEGFVTNAVNVPINTASGTVTSVSVTSAHGLAGVVTNPTTTPAIALSTTVTGIVKGDGTSFLAATAPDFPTLNQNTTGNAATATALQTPRTINGVSFDGSANITVAAAAGTLTGATLAAGITASSLTSVGTLANLTVTNPINGSVTGSAATATSAAKWTTARDLAGNSVDGSANVPFANKFIVQGTADTGLSGAQFLGALATGIVKNTTTTGVLSIATGADLPVMTATIGGAVPTPPNNTTTFLRGDGTFATPSGGSGTVTHTAGALTANAIVLGNGAADIAVLGSLGTTTTVLHGNAAGAPSFGAVSLTTDVSNVLPIANGGTGQSTATAALNALLPAQSGNVGKYLSTDGTNSTWITGLTSILSFIPSTLWASIAGRTITTDLSSYINTAAAASSELYFPPGRYPISGITISTDGVTLQGSGCGLTGSEFYCLGATGDHVYAYNSENLKIDGFSWTTAVTPTAGSFLVTGGHSIVSNIRMEGAFVGIVISKGGTWINTGTINDMVASTGIGISVSFGSGLSISNVNMTCVSSCLAGIKVTQCADLLINGCDLYNCGYDLYVVPTGGPAVGSIQAVNTFFDTAVRGVYMAPTSPSYITRCSFTGCWFGSHSLQGVALDASAGGIDDINFTGCRIESNGLDGFATVGAVANLALNANIVSGNTGSGISLSATAVRTAITGNYIGQTANLAANAYGIFINGGADQYSITGNTFGTNTTANIAGHTPSPTKIVASNIGTGAYAITPQEQIVALASDITGSNVATAQPVFGTGAQTITLAAATTYEFEAEYEIDTTGTTSHSIAILFAVGGSLTSIAYSALGTNGTVSDIPSAPTMLRTNVATAKTLTSAVAAVTQNSIKIKGIIRSNASGSFTPQFQYSAAPGAAPTIRANSYFRLWPIGSNTVASVGNWS